MGALTLGEFKELLAGYEWRHKEEMKKLAQLAAWVTAPHLKRPVAPEKLLKPKKEKAKTKTTQEKSQAIINELMAEMLPNGEGVE